MHPFVVSLYASIQTKKKLYFILEYAPGGELFFHLSRERRFAEPTARFYVAELVLALAFLHAKGVVYRDLKPENILLGRDGHVQLGDFGLAKTGVHAATEGTRSLCGTPEYVAPEVLNKLGYGTAVDWWGLGTILHELLVGTPPWYTEDRQLLFQRIRGAPLVLPPFVSAAAAALLQGLLTKDAASRLGSRAGAADVQAHAFFGALDWDALLRKEYAPPIAPCAGKKPTSADELVENFDPYFTQQSPVSPTVTIDEQKGCMGLLPGSVVGAARGVSSAAGAAAGAGAPGGDETGGAHTTWAGFDFYGVEFACCTGAASSSHDSMGRGHGGAPPRAANQSRRRRTAAKRGGDEDAPIVCCK